MPEMKKIDHLGIAVVDLEKSIELYQSMGFELEGRETVDDQKVETAFFRIGESHIELLAATDPSSPIAKFIEKNGGKGGIAHVAIRVTGIEEHLDRLKKAGFQLIDEFPKTGAHGAKVAFVHPKSTGGVLLELCEKTDD
jgi:methylmalonyl-CoA/ethylmalonyl-CoA epimerase